MRGGQLGDRAAGAALVVLGLLVAVGAYRSWRDCARLVDQAERFLAERAAAAP